MPELSDYRHIVIDAGKPGNWRARLEAHLLRLDPASRQTRFFAPATDRSISALVARARPRALVTFEPDGQIRGAAEIHEGEAAGMAEIAVSVEAEWQHRGVGARLTAEATQLAARLGYDDIRLMCLRRNLPMMRIAKALSARALPLADWATALFRFEPGADGTAGPPAGA
jgi:GNAT superfamily N-acetyltransferase